MQTSLKFRLTLGSAGLLLLLVLYLGWHWLTFAPEAWLQQRLATAGVEDWPAPSVSNDLWAPRLLWQSINISRPGGEFAAEQASLTLSPLSIFIGRPQITELTLVAPIWIGGNTLDGDPMLAIGRLVEQVAPHSFTLERGTLVAGDTEWLDIEAAARRLGASNRFHWQLTGRTEHDAFGGTWTAGAVMQPTETGLRLSEATWKATVNRGYWQGTGSGKLRGASLGTDGNEFEHLSWTLRWRPDIDHFPDGLEWAGAVEKLASTDSGWQLAELDTALAFRATDGNTRRLSALSNHLEITGDQARGQLSLSYQGRVDTQANAVDSVWQDTTLAIEGEAQLTPERLTWSDAELLLGLTAQDKQLSYQLRAERLGLATRTGQWRLDDGSWEVHTDDRPVQSFGFGTLTGTWPELELVEAPPVADDLGRHLGVIGSQLEWTDALRHAVVSAPGS